MKINKAYIFCLAVALVFGFLVVIPFTAHADPNCGQTTDNPATAINETTPCSGSGGAAPAGPVLKNPLSANSIPAVLDSIINFLLTIAAPIAVIMTIWSAYLFITAGENQEKVKQARQTLLWVVIGVAVLILSKGIVNLAKSFLEP